jgi:nicotinate-nucleotide adenylyltransferase
VLLIPANLAPHKSAGVRAAGGVGGLGGPDARDPGPWHRLRMCELIARGIDGLSVCAVEIDRGGMSYTVDTLESLHASHPAAQLTLILGADTASTLGTWRESARVRELAHLAVAARSGAPRGQELDALGKGDSLLEMPPIDVSSSMVRERVARGEPVGGLVREAVADYIAEHRLYGARAEVLG